MAVAKFGFVKDSLPFVFLNLQLSLLFPLSFLLPILVLEVTTASAAATSTSNTLNV